MTRGARPGAARSPWRRRWWWRIAPWALAAAVIALLARQALTMDWAAVGAALRDESPRRIALGAALGITSHALYASYDLVSRRLLRHELSATRTALIALTSYAFNLNFGALLGGMALRLRLYTRRGVDAAVAAQVIGWSLVSNWLGYALSAGITLSLAPPALPAHWPVGEATLRAVGAGLLVIAVAWLAACARAGHRELRWRELRVTLPPLRIALLQAALSSANWLLIGALVWALLGGSVEFPTVLAVTQLAAVAGVITHVPAGLGVLEATFVAILGERVAPATLLAALLVYRALYYLLPLTWAVPAYFHGESTTRATTPAGGGADARAGT